MIKIQHGREPFSHNKLALAISTALALGPMPLLAAPTDGVVVSGSAVIGQTDAATNITQHTQKATINWQGFSVGRGETVNFQQPDSSAITLNRVLGNERSLIEGALHANGQIFLINSNGVLFTKGSSVNAAGLVASTLDIRNEDFEAGRYVFQGSGGSGSVINMGTLSAADGGYVALLGKEALNQGVVVATRGTAALGAGERITLNFNGDSLLSVSIDQGALDALVKNREAIYADGGKVFLTARAADELLGSQVNNDGLVQARTLADLKGEIVAYAYGGTANIAGTLDASAPDGGDGGFIETSGEHVKIADSAVITAKAASGKNGTWLIDPDGYTIANSGGDMTATQLAGFLSNDAANIIIQSTQGSGSDGDLNVNDAVSWNSNAKLTLQATHNVNVNAAITAGGDSAGLTLTAGQDVNVNNAITLSGDHAALALNYGRDYNIRTKASYSGTVLDANGNPIAKPDTSGGVYGSVTLPGSNSSLTLNNQNYTLIRNMDSLAAISGVNGFYALANDLDAASWSSAHIGAASVVNSFLGSLTGLGHTVSKLTLRSSDPNVGLIGDATKSRRVTAIWSIHDIGVIGADITANGSSGYNGILAGSISRVNINNVYSTGHVHTNGNVGGLVGAFSGATLSNAYSTADVVNTAGSFAGGLVGYEGNNAEINHVHATGSVNSTLSTTKTSGSDSGGLIGYISDANVSNAYALGNVEGNSASVGLGGLVGEYLSSSPQSITLQNSFATGNVTGGTNLGGLIGKLTFNGDGNVTIQNVYATGNVTAMFSEDTWLDQGVGGLIGNVNATSSVLALDRAHATGKVAISDDYNFSIAGGPSYVGGLLGWLTVKSGTIANVYATGDVYAAKAFNVGGLIGAANGRGRDGLVLTVSDSFATGNVTGKGFVGGLFGGFYGELSQLRHEVGAVVSRSYASGKVVGEKWVGGITGYADGTVIGSDVYFNGEGVAGSVGRAGGDITDHSHGLTGNQVADMAYYANGTIDQVLAERAATEAAAQAAADAAAQAAAEAAAKASADAAAQAAAEAAAKAAADAAVQAAAEAAAQAAKATVARTASQLGSTRAAEAQRQAVATVAVGTGSPAAPSTNLDSNIVINDPASYSANVRRIEVDGVIYDLDEEEKPNSNNSK